MRVCFDENMPLPLRLVLRGHDVSSVQAEGWKSKDTGEFRALLEGGFDVFVTSDGSIQHQHNLLGCSLSLVIVSTNNLTRLKANAIAIRITLDEVAGYEHAVVVTIDWKGRRTVRGLTDFRPECHRNSDLSSLGRPCGHPRAGPDGRAGCAEVTVERSLSLNR
jgi:hypothetical protein